MFKKFGQPELCKGKNTAIILKLVVTKLLKIFPAFYGTQVLTLRLLMPLTC